MTLKSILTRNKKQLNEYCRRVIREGVSTVRDEWITDNYRTCLTALQTATDFLSSEGEKGLLPFFISVKLWCEGCGEITQTKIIEKFSEEENSILKSRALKYMLYGAFSCLVCENLNEENDEVITYIKNLYALRDISFEEVIACISECERLLHSDPSGDYCNMNEETKEIYRKAISLCARKEGIDEVVVTEKALNSAKKRNCHIGFFLPVVKDKTAYAVAFTLIEWAVSLIVSIILSALLIKSVLGFLLLIFPVYQFIKPFSDRIREKIFPPYRLFSMDEDRIAYPETVISISAVLPSGSKINEMYSHLYDVYSSVKGVKARLVLLIDLASAKSQEISSDEADKAAVKRLIDSLNLEFGGGFVVALRDRVYSSGENEYTGFERKRGAVTALMKYLKHGIKSDFSLIYGDTDKLEGVKYVLALDSDTRLSLGVMKQLLSKALHPLNKAVIDKNNKKTVSGYGIFSPRVETSVESAEKTVFASLYTGGGSVFYAPRVNERYMDMFGEGIFTGKGLIDVEAFDYCIGDEFEEGRILSHDILEGSVLRTAFVSSSELTDNFPSNASAYFSRLHRWIRGDIQNLRYIFRGLGKNGKNPFMSPLGKYQLFDNMRRAVTPVNAVLLLLLSCFSGYYGQYIYLLASVLCVTSQHLLPIIVSFVKNGTRGFSSLYFSDNISVVNKEILRGFIALGSLPENCIVSLDAVLRAAYRSLISHKKLLSWLTAADAEKSAKKNLLFACVFPVAIAAALFFWGNALHRLISLIILFFVPMALSDGIIKNKRPKEKLSENEKRILHSFVCAGWRYFEENVTANENYLPPDNIQETPVPRKAHRTSPTNIGLYLVSVLAAADLNIITAEKMLTMIDNTLSTVELMSKYKGMLYNWYDTVTLRVLNPHYVSSVDVGNFLVCLTALKEGLKEYVSYCVKAESIIKRIEKILDENDLSLLYDKKRELFYVGIDCISGKPSESHYDFYMSEARMTSYYACAKGIVSLRHWQNLDRSLIKCGRYTAVASWTGTMFEYFMPLLFLDNIRGAFQNEALKVCVYLQKKFTLRDDIPYGISESCFYSTDSSLNYRYKAHGIRVLAAKRNADCEKVISPYSTFLTLPVDIKGAMKNFSRLSALHSEGRYGFYEAVDFTSGRLDGEEYAVVRCYMSHHIGMSIIAAVNALNDNIFVKRFMSERDMKGAKSLLEERLPDTEAVKSPIRQSRAVNARKSYEQKVNRKSSSEGKEAFAYSNGEVTLFSDKYGRNRTVFAGTEITAYDEISNGFCAGVQTDSKMINLFPCENVNLNKYALTKPVIDGDISIYSGICVHPSENSLLIPIKIENNTDKPQTFKLCFCFKPLLLPCLKDDLHPAFSDMFLEIREDKKHKAIISYRKNSDEAPVIACGFYDKASFQYSLDREKLFPYPFDGENPFGGNFSVEENTGRGVRPVAALCREIKVSAGKSCEAVFLAALGTSEEGAVFSLNRVRGSALPDIKKGASAPFLRDELTFFGACDFISRAFFCGKLSEITKKARQTLRCSKEALWQTGISGDLPIITVFPEKNCTEQLLRAYVRLFRRLKNCSVSADIVFIFEADGGYMNDNVRRVTSILNEEGVSDSIGKKGGVHIFSLSELSENSFASILAFSLLLYPDESEKAEVFKENKDKILHVTSVYGGENAFTDKGYLVSKTPLLPWCHTLSNNSFGTLVTESSLGFTWAMNSRQNKISPWSNDTSLGFVGERILLSVDGRVYDIVKNSLTEFTPDCVRYAGKADCLTVVVKVQVAEKGMRKRVSVELGNNSEGKKNVEISYSVKAVLHESEGFSDFVHFSEKENCIFAENPLNSDYKGVMCLACADKESFCITENEDGSLKNRKAKILQKFVLESKDKKIISFDMSFAKTKKSAEKLAFMPFFSKKTKAPVFASGYKKLDEFANSLLYHQVADTRIRARCGFYQCSGAWGFRDQLQDALALINLDNKTVRKVILRAASAQFSEGDVLHWFHVMYKDRLIYKGVRSRVSDDRLFLPYAVSRYVLECGDIGILDIKIPFLGGEILVSGENERYSEYSPSREARSIYTHCLKAIACSMKTGKHGLPLMECGDWNDSFNSLGEKGRGESVWLGMFLADVLRKFAKICAIKKDFELEKSFVQRSDELKQAIDRYAYNGKWYLRAFADNGEALGDEGNESCEIDLICQAWSSFCDMPDKDRVKTALLYAYERLFDEENGVIRLFSPPFNEKSVRAGYVNFYPEGMRENGGQYTHAAVWFIIALFKEGLTAQAEKALEALLPSLKYEKGFGDVYKTEPYALAGDVYSAQGFTGRGGWSLYTGSAGWLLQLVKFLEKGNFNF